MLYIYYISDDESHVLQSTTLGAVFLLRWSGLYSIRTSAFIFFIIYFPADTRTIYPPASAPQIKTPLMQTNGASREKARVGEKGAQ